MASPSTLIFGCGYLGARVGRLLVDRGHPVFGTTRSPGKGDRLAAWGIRPVIIDVTDAGDWVELPSVDRVLYCVGFDRGSGQSIRQVYVDGLRRVLETLGTRQPRCSVVYASSTGVYGGNDGDWVDEASPVAPQTESGQACFDAEQLVTAHADRYSAGATILRYAGLYGPDRIMRRDSLKRGEPVPGNPAKFLNLIQIDDAAAITVRALDEVEPGGRDLFLVADGNPVVRSQFYGVVAELLQAPPPRFEPPIPGTPTAQREESNKRVSNGKLIERWGNILRYPDIRSGLTASLFGS